MEKKRIETIMCFLPLTLVFVCEPFSTFFKRKIKCIVAYMCKCQIPAKIHIKSNFN